MSNPIPEALKSNVDLLKLLVAGDSLAENLVEAAVSNPNRDQALAATKAVLLSHVETGLAQLKNATNKLA
jgi:hypothetical protein